MPLGSVMYSLGFESCGSKPTMRVEMPKGRTPPDWVYRCRVSWQTAQRHRETHLLDTGDVLGDVFDRDGVFNGQTVGLALDTGLVDQDAAVGGQAYCISGGVRSEGREVRGMRYGRGTYLRKQCRHGHPAWPPF